MKIDTNFNVETDAKGGDPDITSPTLRLYHKILWSKPLPNGHVFELSNTKSGAYLYHNSEIGEYFLGSDGICHSYKNHKRKKWLTNQIQNEVDDFYKYCSTVASFMVFPNKRVDKKNTINQARGVNVLIDDRFDLTLECIRLYYLGQSNPLYDTLIRYKSFFDLFESFQGYTKFFFLDDLVDENQNIIFYLPFDGFKSRPKFNSIDDYLLYKKNVFSFVRSRKNKIEAYANKLMNDHGTGC